MSLRIEAYNLDQRGRQLYAYKRRWVNRMHLLLAVLLMVFLVKVVRPFSITQLTDEQATALFGEPDVTVPVKVASINNPDDDAVLLVARTMWGELKGSRIPVQEQLHQAELMAWVIRNRVDTQYRDKATYWAVVRDPKQFTPWEVPSRKRIMMAVDLDTPPHKEPVWAAFVAIARNVISADRSDAPYPIKTRHYAHEYAVANWIPDSPDIIVDGGPSYELYGYTSVD